MSNKVKLLSAAVASALSMGFAGQAAATVYAGSALEIDDITVIIGSNNTGGAAPTVGTTPTVNVGAGDVILNNFTFTTKNDAQLNNGVVSSQANTCSGTPTSNNCGVAPTLDALATNAAGSTINRTNNQTSGDGTFTWFPLDGGNWSNSDSVIYTSELTNGQPTDTDQIAQSNITSATSALASAQITSVTGLTLNFTINGPNPTDFTFLMYADPDMIAQIFNDTGIAWSSQATMSLSVSLSNDADGSSLIWRPQGNTQNNCLTDFGTCYELSDAEDLNQTIAVTQNNTTNPYSYGPNAEGSLFYQIYLTGLYAGDWTLDLSATTSTNVTRQVPEPATLALLGAGLAGLGFAGRRQRKQQA